MADFSCGHMECRTLFRLSPPKRETRDPVQPILNFQDKHFLEFFGRKVKGSFPGFQVEILCNSFCTEQSTLRLYTCSNSKIKITVLAVDFRKLSIKQNGCVS